MTHDLYLYKVVEVLPLTDADTLNLRISLGFGITATFRFRLAGVNAPEVYGKNAEPRGKDAMLFAAAWLDERRDHLVVRTYKGSRAAIGLGDGAFGRWKADVLAPDGSLGDHLVQAGLADWSEG